MQMSQVLSMLTNLIQMNTPDDRESNRPVLKNYPNCGELGREEGKECYWDCEWQPFSKELDEQYGYLFRVKQHTTNTECLKGCSSINYCLGEHFPDFVDLILSGETNTTVYVEQVFVPYLLCLITAAGEDYPSYIVSDSCLAYYYMFLQSEEETFTYYDVPCFLKLLPR